MCERSVCSLCLYFTGPYMTCQLSNILYKSGGKVHSDISVYIRVNTKTHERVSLYTVELRNVPFLVQGLDFLKRRCFIFGKFRDQIWCETAQNTKYLPGGVFLEEKSYNFLGVDFETYLCVHNSEFAICHIFKARQRKWRKNTIELHVG